MLTQYEIDNLMQSIQSDGRAYLYYVAHMIEQREGLVGEDLYKSASRFKVIKVEVKDIKNAYFEYLKYVENPDNYHVESETCYYDSTDRYTNFYIVPNGNDSYELDINPRIPSIIYGVHKEIYDINTEEMKEVTEDTPIKCVYTNTLEYGSNTYSETLSDLNNGKLDWKYKKLNENKLIDGVAYSYITGDWYILELKNFPTVEMPLINVNRKCSYFVYLADALSYIEQLEA